MARRSGHWPEDHCAAFRAGAGHHLKSLSGRFAAMVFGGEPVTVRYGRSARAGEVLFTVLNARGETAIAAGRATFDP